MGSRGRTKSKVCFANTCLCPDTCCALGQGTPRKFPSTLAPLPRSLTLRVLCELLFALDPVPPLCQPPDSIPSGSWFILFKSTGTSALFLKTTRLDQSRHLRLLRHQLGPQPEAHPHVWGRSMLWTLPGPHAAHTSAPEEPKSGLGLGEGFGSGMAHPTLPVSVSANTPHTEALEQQRSVSHSSGGWTSRPGYWHCRVHLFQACRWLSFCCVLTWQGEKASSLVSLLIRAPIPSQRPHPRGLLKAQPPNAIALGSKTST